MRISSLLDNIQPLNIDYMDLDIQEPLCVRARVRARVRVRACTCVCVRVRACACVCVKNANKMACARTHKLFFAHTHAHRGGNPES